MKSINSAPRLVNRSNSLLLFSSVVLLQLASSSPLAQAAVDSSWSALYKDGLSELSQQKLDRAEDSFRKALSTAQAAGNSADTEKCMRKLADVLMLRNRPADALPLYEKLLRSLSKHYGASSAQIAPVLMELGSIQEAAGDHTTAISYYQRALSINERNYGPYSPAVAGSLQGLGRANGKAGNKALAVQHFKRSQSILILDPDLKASSQLESLMHDYGDLIKGDDNSNKDLLKDFQADILGKTNDDSSAGTESSRSGSTWGTSASNQSSTKAGSSFQKQTRIQFDAGSQSQINEDPKVLLRGIENPSSSSALAPAFNVMNDSIFKQSHYEKGESYYQRTIAADIDALGPSHPTVANDLSGLGMLYISQEKYQQAEPLLSRALAIYEKVYGSNNMLTINCKVTLAAAEFHVGNVDKASELYKAALTSGQAALGPNSLETARILNDIAYLHFHQGKLQESRTFYQWALASTEGAVGEHNPLLAACLKDYAQVLRGLGQAKEASDAESRADKILANSQQSGTN